MITTKIRSLLYKGIKFVWSDDLKAQFDKVIASLSNLDKLEPYNPQNDMFALVDASLAFHLHFTGWLHFPEACSDKMEHP